MVRTRVVIVLGVALMLLAAACGDSDDAAVGSADTIEAAGSTESAVTPDASAPATSAPDEGAGGDAAGSGGSGALVLGDQTIAFDSARCFLQEQDAAAGGGKILFVAQAFGTDAAGEPVAIDVSRYDQDSQFFGDDIIVDIGDPSSEDGVSLGARGEVGTVTVDGSRISAATLTFLDFDDATEQSGSFEINC